MPARKSPLRAVAADEKPAAKKPKTITEAATEGTGRDLLVMTLTRLARTLDDPTCPPRDQASISRRVLEIRSQIEAIDATADQEAAESAEVADEAFDAEAL